MTAIVSNGTGGGNASAGASWAGGVAPVEGDTCRIASGDTITIDANWTVGADSATPAIDVLNGGTLDWDGLGAADVVTCKGDFYVRSGGTLTLSGVADVTKTLTIKTNYSAALASGKYGIINENGSTVTVTGFNKTRAWDTLSADAAALQKNAITTNNNSSNWYVNDEFVVGSMTRQGTTGAETDTIGSFAGTTITKAGANYVYKHDQNVAICNLTRNIIITSYDVTKFGYWLNKSQTGANFTLSWVRFTYMGYNAASKYGLSWDSAACDGSFDYCVFDHSGYIGINMNPATPTARTITGVICYANVGGPYFYYSLGSAANVVTGLVIIGISSTTVGACQNATVSNFHIANNTRSMAFGASTTISTGRVYGNTTNVSAGLCMSVSPPLAIDTVYLDGNGYGVGVANGYATNLYFGVQVANTTDITCVGTVFKCRANTVALTCSVTAPGGQISAEYYPGAKTWRYEGTYSKSNAVPRTGTYSMLMSPTSASDALIAQSTVPASSGVQVAVTAYMRHNAAYGALTMPFIRLSGAGVTTDTDTIADIDDAWQLVTVAGTPTEDGFCKVEFVAQSAGVGAAVYVDDVKMVYTAIDTGGMDYWYQGDMPPILMATGLGATDVWAATMLQSNTPGSMGEALQSSFVRVNAVTSGAALNVVLDASASASNDYYNEDYIMILSGTGAGQCRRVVDYDGGSKTVTINRAWTTNPDLTSRYAIIPFFSVENAVLDSLTAAHSVAGSFGKLFNDYLDAAVSTRLATVGYTVPPTVGAIADAVLDEAGAGHAGLIPTNLDVTVGSRATPAQITAAQAVITALLPAALVGGRMDSSIGAITAAIANAIADATLTRDVDQVEALTAIDSLCSAILKSVSRVRDNAGALETFRTDGVTLHMSQPMITNAGLNPLSELGEAV